MGIAYSAAVLGSAPHHPAWIRSRGRFVFNDLSLFEVALLATMLAPNDAALGKGVVTNPAVPNGVRQGLNVESGLNDGICVPVLFLFLTLALGHGMVIRARALLRSPSSPRKLASGAWSSDCH